MKNFIANGDFILLDNPADFSDHILKRTAIGTPPRLSFVARSNDASNLVDNTGRMGKSKIYMKHIGFLDNWCVTFSTYYLKILFIPIAITAPYLGGLSCAFQLLRACACFNGPI